MSKAQISKEKGNEAFKAGKFADAIGFYTAAIIADRTEPTYPLNRAAAYLKLGKNEDAERDCTMVLDLKPKFAVSAKALFRRGQARVAMDRLQDALKDFGEAMKYAPEDPNIKKALTECSEKLDEKVERARASKKAKALDIDPKSPPLRRRVPIEIIHPPAPTTTSTTEEKKASTSDAGLTTVSSRPLKPSSSTEPPPQGPSKPQPVARAEINPLPSSEKPSSFKEAKQNRDTARPSRVGGGIFSNKAPPKVFPTRDVTPPNTTQSASSAQPNGAQGPAPPVQKKRPTFKAPGTLSDLVKVWNTQKTAEDRWALLSTIPPSQFPSLAKSSLEPVFLASLFQTLHDVLSAADLDTQIAVKAFMEYLPLVSRFNTIFLFLSKSEKGLVKDIWKRLGVDTEKGDVLDGMWATLLK